MCGRYTLTVELDEIAERFGCPKVELVFKHRYNVAPTNIMPVIVSPGGARQIQFMQWGLVPCWSPDRSIGPKMINARAETVAQKPAFRAAYRHRRCLVPATGYYEWQQQGSQKQPYYIHMPDRKLFAFAGLWEEWSEGSGVKLYSFTILTTEPSPSVAHLHNRMPLILPYEQEATWLQGQPLATPEYQLGSYEVSPLVNRTVNDLPECIKPLR
ncbi:MAG: SOS response-associated peptidase [Firmicutes bacterium]|nr:SOS response-associated peptidase [Bacillota bacterium]